MDSKSASNAEGKDEASLNKVEATTQNEVPEIEGEHEVLFY